MRVDESDVMKENFHSQIEATDYHCQQKKFKLDCTFQNELLFLAFIYFSQFIEVRRSQQRPTQNGE